MTKEFEERTRSLEGEIVLLKRAVVQGTPSTSDLPPAKVRVPEPKPFGGARNAKDLENFLWDMEQYFICGTPFLAISVLADPKRVLDALLLLNHSKSNLCGSDFNLG